MNEIAIDKCVLCGKDIEKTELNDRDIFSYHCKICGEVLITEDLKREISPYQEKLHLLSGYTREHTDKNLKPTVLDLSSIKQILSTEVPKNVPEKIDRLFLKIAEKSEETLGKDVSFSTEKDYPLGYAKDLLEFRYMIEHLEKLKLIKKTNKAHYMLTVEGWKRFEELRKRVIESKQCFVAMQFNDEELDEVYDGAIERAISDAGYDPYRIDRIEHIEDICDKIIVEINRSRFLFADFTERNRGVYFEAGYAKGKGIPVIWSCHRKDKDDLHFDTEHYNHILWDTAEELKKKLYNRILELPTIGRAK